MRFYKKQAAAGDLPVLETPAGAANIEEGKQAISASGSVITGELSSMVSVSKVASNVKVNGSDLEMNTKYTAKHIFDTNTSITLKKDLSNFGDATAADVATGKTFTSSAGLKVTGTKESGAALPTLTNPAGASDIASGKQAIDGAGIKVVGTLSTVTNGGTTHDGTPEEWENYIRSKYTLSNDILIRSGNDISIRTAKTEYGDATAADVAAGKTFTSAAGLKVAGTGVMVKTGIASISSNKILTIPETGLTEFILYSEDMTTEPTPTNTVTILIYRNLEKKHIRICYKHDYYNSMSANIFIEYSGTTNNRVSVIDNGTNTTITLDSSFTAKFNVAMRYIGF